MHKQQGNNASQDLTKAGTPGSGRSSTQPACPGGWKRFGLQREQCQEQDGTPAHPPSRHSSMRGAPPLSLWVNQLRSQMVLREWIAPPEPGIGTAEPPAPVPALHCAPSPSERRSYFSARGYRILPVLHINNQILTQKCQSLLRADKEA